MPKYNTRIILGIDPGIADTGFGVVTQTEHRLITLDYGTIKTPAHTPLPNRLLELYRSLEKIISRYHPTHIAVEKLFFAKNVTTAFTVGQARGVVLLAAGKYGLETSEFTPLQIKQALTSYGRASKQQVQHMVKAVLALPVVPKPDDAADALACAICYAHSVPQGHA